MEHDIFISVVAPVFNEEENIEAVIRYWNRILDEKPLASEIVVTNDGSRDRTAEILNRLQQEFPRLRVNTFQQNGGYGRALNAAIHASSGEWVVTLDSDGQFDLQDAWALLELAQAEDFDGVTGYRLKKKDTFFRVLADRVLNRIVRFVFSLRFRDTNCALKVVRGKLMRQVGLEARGYPAPTELMIKLSALGARWGEQGVTHLEREGGLSKLKPIRTGINFLKFLVYLRLKLHLFRQRILNQV